MSNILKFSEAAIIALHSMFLLALNNDRLLSTREIATIMAVSENHLSKVLQRLIKAGLVESIRGPKGGFKLGKNPDEIMLLDVYEAIDGKLDLCECLLDTKMCKDNARCILGSLISNINKEVKDSLSLRSLSEIVKQY